MKLVKPVAAGAFGIVIASVIALAVSLSRQRPHPVRAEGSDKQYRAHPEPTGTHARSAAQAAAWSQDTEAEPASLTPLQRAQREAVDRKHYLVALFYDPDSPEGRRARTRVAKAVAKEYRDRMEVFEVPTNAAEHQATIRRLSVFTTPLALVFSRTGAVTRHFQKFDDVNAELAQALLSPKTEEVLAGLQERKVVFIHVWRAQGKMRAHNRAELEGLRRLLSASVHAVYIQADEPKEQRLLRETVELDPAKEAPVTVVVARSGAIVEKIPGKLTRELLLQAYRKVLVYRSGCGGMGSGPDGGTCQ